MITETAVEIPKDRWPAYANDLSKQYVGWGVTIEILDRELGDQQAAAGPPLQGISFETKGSACGDLLVEVGDIGTPYEVHRIHRPRVLRAAETQPGGELDIYVESEDGTANVIRLRRRPELPPGPSAQQSSKSAATRAPAANARRNR